MEEKVFDLGTLLTVTTPILFTNISNLYKLLSYMTGDDIFTHQLTRVADEMRPVILQQYPELESVDASGVNTDNWWYFLDEQKKKFGDSFVIIPCGLFDHKRIDPQEELEQIIDPSRIFIIPNLEGEDE